MDIYSTSYGKQISGIAEEVTKVLKQYIIRKEEYLMSSKMDNIYYIHAQDENIRQWDFPIIIDGNAYVDIRPHLTKENKPRNHPEITAAFERARFELEWIESKRTYEPVSVFTSIVFGTWLSSVIGYRYSLNAADKARIQVILSAYYLSIFMSDEGINRDEYDLITLQITRNLKFSPEFINPIFEFESDTDTNVETLYDALMVPADKHGDRLDRVCGFINDIITNPIQELTPSGLVSLVVSGSWMGHLSPSLTTASLQHPPIFISLMWRSTTSNFYERSAIGAAVKENRRNRLSKGFPKWASMIQLSKEH